MKIKTWFRKWMDSRPSEIIARYQVALETIAYEAEFHMQPIFSDMKKEKVRTIGVIALDALGRRSICDGIDLRKMDGMNYPTSFEQMDQQLVSH